MRHRKVGIGLVLVVLGGPAAAQFTQRVSVSSSGVQGSYSSSSPSISGDGRYVAFGSSAPALVPGDDNASTDVFVRDRVGKTTTRVSVATTGVEGDLDSDNPSISADGRYVAFASLATSLVPGDTNGAWDVFVRDRQAGTTTRVSVGPAGVQADDFSGNPSLSADGRFVAFWSQASNLVPGDTNDRKDVFVHDRQTGTTTRASVDSSGGQADLDSVYCSISGDGRYVAFQQLGGALAPPDTNDAWDILVRDRQAGTTVRVSVDTGGVEALGDSQFPSISADGRYVAFQSAAPNLVPFDTNGVQDVFVRDRQTGITSRASVSTTGVQGDDFSFGPSISADGRYVAFPSYAMTLVLADTNGPFQSDTFLHDNLAGTTTRVNLGPSGAQDDGGASYASISADGRVVAFDSNGQNLVLGDTNDASDVFVRDLFGGTGFTSLCDPGLAGVIACPCGNPPAGPGRGCGNSSSTGGAVLAATGGAFLSEDTLAFTTTGERPTATSFLLQATAPVASGVVYGQGVRCLTGTLRRLYNRSASGGSITVPDPDHGELPVSVRSAVVGSPISAGESRWYLVAYRDPIVLGGCPAHQTFNATQTGCVLWSP